MVPVPLAELRRRQGGPRHPRAGTVPERALTFLRSRPEEAWRPVELADALGEDQNTVGSALTRLRRRGLIDNIDGHWFALSDRDIAKRHATVAANRRANEKWGPENPEDWPAADRA